MSRIKNLFVLFLAATMMFSFSTPVKAEVEPLISVEKQQYFYRGATFENIQGQTLEYKDGYFLNLSTGEITPMALDPVSIIVGVVVAWIVDGALIMATGYSGAEWAAYGMNALADYTKGLWRGATNYFMNKTTKKVSYATNNRGCFLGDPFGYTYICPYSL